MFSGVVACLLVLTLNGVLAQITESPVVQTQHGPVRGNNVTMQEPAGHVFSFWNIPYAAPPVGPLRFQVSSDSCSRNPGGISLQTLQQSY